MSIQPNFNSEPNRRLRGATPPGRVRVILHRAADQGLVTIVQVLRKLTRFGEAEAETRMWQAYHNGKATVLVTHFERAELYVEQFAENGLLASIEPA